MRIRYFYGTSEKPWGPIGDARRLPPRAMTEETEDDPHAFIPPDLHATLKDVVKRISEPPRTWAKYLANGEYWGIVDMEFREVERVVKDFRSGAATADQVMMELCHLASATVQARVHMMAQNKEK